MANGHGGARPGAGRKPKQAKALIEEINGRIGGDADDLLRELFDLAHGKVHHVEGDKRIYSRAPDRDAAIYLINRAIGKPVHQQEVGDCANHFRVTVELAEDKDGKG